MFQRGRVNADDLASGAASAYENVATGIAINIQGPVQQQHSRTREVPHVGGERGPRPWVS